MQFRQNFPLSELTTLKIGGPAREFIEVFSQEELMEAIESSKKLSLPFLIVGGGSNLLISDSGINKLVIKNSIEGIEKIVNVLKVKSGFVLQHLVDYAIGNSLAGLQKLTGIPGTVGGAVYGNAGAYGQTISDYLKEVKALNPKTGNVETFDKDECEFSYRDSIFKKNGFVILELTFKLEHGEVKDLRKEADETLEKRLIKYPKGIKCPGSFFKNLVAEQLPKDVLSKIPKNKIVYGKVPAGSLLEEVGAKGDFLGDIEIAPYHANLFINKAEGKASDFYNLARKYALKVKDRFGISLEPEVQLINLPPIL